MIKARESTITYKDNVSKKKKVINEVKLYNIQDDIEAILKKIESSYNTISTYADKIYTTGSESGGQMADDNFGLEIKEIRDDAKDRATYTSNKVAAMKKKVRNDIAAETNTMKRLLAKLQNKKRKQKSVSKSTKN